MSVASLQNHGYLPVATASISRASVLTFDLYLRRRGSAFTELYRSASYPIEADDIARLRKDGVDRLYIKCENAEAYREYLCTEVLSDPDAPPTARVEALREATRAAFQEALVASDHDSLVAVATDFGGQMSRVVANGSMPFRELFTTLEHDYYTFTHVCNVSVYSVMLAGQLGISDANELSQIAAGALLHDIGKRHIPASVLNKAGKLTDEEWEQIREHPVSGFRELVDRNDLIWPQLMMVYQHHEKLDGSGYPTGIYGDEIHSWARICSVADVFDALTCQRPYRKPVPRTDVCEHLEKHAGTWFDKAMVQCWASRVRSVT
jgi:HD-GYP domain-containing protein (c-di-GMP phosphodiesterase class II)